MAPNTARSGRTPRAPPRAGGRWGWRSARGWRRRCWRFCWCGAAWPPALQHPALVSVVVAAQDIPARTRLTDGFAASPRVPPADVPEGAVAARADLVGKVVLRPILAGKAVTAQAVAAPGAALGMAFALPPSQRAVTVALDPADGVDEFARPGDHVDILATDEPGSGPAETRTVLQNVALLAVGSQTSPDERCCLRRLRRRPGVPMSPSPSRPPRRRRWCWPPRGAKSIWRCAPPMMPASCRCPSFPRLRRCRPRRGPRRPRRSKTAPGACGRDGAAAGSLAFAAPAGCRCRRARRV